MAENEKDIPVKEQEDGSALVALEQTADPFEEVKEGRKVVAIRFDFKPTFTRRAVDPSTGKKRNIYIKPKQKLKAPEPNDISEVHPDQQTQPSVGLHLVLEQARQRQTQGQGFEGQPTSPGSHWGPPQFPTQ